MVEQEHWLPLCPEGRACSRSVSAFVDMFLFSCRSPQAHRRSASLNDAKERIRGRLWTPSMVILLLHVLEALEGEKLKLWHLGWPRQFHIPQAGRRTSSSVLALCL